MEVETWIQRRNNISRRKFVELDLDMLGILPAGKTDF
jgi:hypothetical protein